VVDVIRKPRGSEVLVRRLKSVVKTSNRTDQLRSGGSAICAKLLLRPDISRAYWKNADLDRTPWRIQHRPPAGVERGSVHDLPCDLSGTFP
jgi:hypothetical protein